MRTIKIIRNRRFILVTLSIILQFTLAAFLGHHYDMGIFFTVGYAVSNGNSPYGLFPASIIFDNPAFFEELPGIGYPPPWALYLGLVYSLVYQTTKNIFVYNLAIKLPIILSNIGLAFIVERIAFTQNMKRETCNKMFYFLLFNPFIIYVSAIWGQFDSLVILTTILALNELYNHKIFSSAILIGLSSSLKILPLILLPMFIIFIKRNYDLKSNFKFITMFFSVFILLAYSPFLIFNWDTSIIFNNADFHFIRAGGFTLFNIFDLMYDQTFLFVDLEFLGYLWIPALLLTLFHLHKTRLDNYLDLVRWASSLFFVLMLTRSWVSEQNIVLLIPLVLLMTVSNNNWSMAHFIWIMPLFFSFVNTSPFQMFFLISSKPIEFIKEFDLSYRIPRLMLKFILAVAWQVGGWIYVIRTFTVRSK